MDATKKQITRSMSSAPAAWQVVPLKHISPGEAKLVRAALLIG